jgi:hypothetical protein
MKIKNPNQPASKEDLRRLLLEVLERLADDVRSLKEAPARHAKGQAENGDDRGIN